MAEYASVQGPADIRRTVKPTDPIEVLETELALLHRALERLARRSDIHRDLDRASYLLARTLEVTGPISLKDLAAGLGLDATTVTRQVATMEGQGLARRRAQPSDGRVSLIELAPEGQRKMRVEQRARQGRVRGLVARWSKRDQVDLGRLLARLNDAIGDIEHPTPQDPGRATAPREGRA